MGKTITFRPTIQEEDLLEQASGLLGANGRSQVIHILLKKGFESLTQEKDTSSFESSGFIGCGESDNKNTAGNHKKHINDSLDKKWS